MGALAVVQRTLSRGASRTTFRYPVYGQGGSTYGGGGGGFWNDTFNGRILPGADFDYLRESGDLWKNAVVGAVLNFLLCCAVEPRLVVKRKVGTEEEEVPNHPLIELLENPNDDDDDTNFLVGCYTFDYNLWGNAYYLLLRSGAGKVTGIQYLPRRLVRPIPDKTGVKRVAGYAYWVDGKPILFDTQDVIQFRFGIDPDNPREGLAPLLASCRDICGENSLATMGAAVARNHGIPGYFIQPADPNPNDPIGADKIEEGFAKKLQRFWQEKFGRDNAAQPMVVTQRVKIERLGFSPDELMADKSRAVAVSRICAALRIDPMVLGLPSESKTYSNLAESYRAAFNNNIFPNGDSYCSKMTRIFRREVGYLLPNERLCFDYSLVGALQDDMDALYKRLVLACGGAFMQVNEARKRGGYIEVEGQDRIREPKGNGGAASGSGDDKGGDQTDSASDDTDDDEEDDEE